jgi:hypothetical protein
MGNERPKSVAFADLAGRVEEHVSPPAAAVAGPSGVANA